MDGCSAHVSVTIYTDCEEGLSRQSHRHMHGIHTFRAHLGTLESTQTDIDNSLRICADLKYRSIHTDTGTRTQNNKNPQGIQHTLPILPSHVGIPVSRHGNPCHQGPYHTINRGK